jgi:hypothetical protein
LIEFYIKEINFSKVNENEMKISKILTGFKIFLSFDIFLENEELLNRFKFSINELLLN